MNPEKMKLGRGRNETILLIFAVAAVMLLILPLWTSFQDVLTRLIMKIGWYRQIQEFIVPYELRVIGTVLSLVGLPIRVGSSYIEWVTPSGGQEAIYLIWNCVGWQSLVMLLITFMTGLSGRHTLSSKIETLVLGLLGTYLINLIRIAFVIIIYFHIGRPLGSVFHDYFSGMLTILWLLWFWWYSYKYVLEERRAQV